MGILDSVLGKKKEGKIEEHLKPEQIDDPVSLFRLGVQLYNRVEYGKAEDEFRKLLRLNLAHKEAHYYLGRIYESRVKSDDDFEAMEEAMREYQEAIKIDQSYVDAHIRLGGLYVKSCFYEGGMRELEEALRINPNLSEAHAAMGNACYTIGTAKEVKVEHPAGVGAASDFRGAKEYYKKAIEEFNQAINLAPDLSAELQPLIQRAGQKVK